MWEDTKQALRVVGIVLVALAVIEELQKPKPARTWTGKLFDLIPYDLRFPTLERFADRFWNPADSRILVEHPFGVGWAINMASLLSSVQERLEGRRGQPLATVPQESLARQAKR